MKKLSFPLKSFVFDKKFSSEILKKEIFEESNLPGWLKETLKLTNPSLLNCYKRKYFLSCNKKYRATLDHDLVFFLIKDKNNFFGQKIKDIQNVILEIKYNGKEDKQISHITQSFPFRLTKNSKYVSGIDMLHL